MSAFSTPPGHLATASRLDVHPPCPPRACPTCTVQAAIELLRTGRPHMALRLLQDVPALLTEALGMAYARGHDDVVLGRASGPPPASLMLPRAA